MNSHRLINLKGKKFGSFIVLKLDTNHEKASYSYWICKCKFCGREKSYRSDVVRKRTPTSCGCKSNAVKVGNIYGYLTVLSLINKKARSPHWKCACVCGKIIERTSNALKQREKPSCGCKKNPKGSDHPSYIGYKNISGSIMDKIRRGAESRSIKFQITAKEINDLLEKQKYKCSLSGLDISTDKKNITASLDRICSDKSYTIDNVQWVHKDINLMKNRLEQKRFIDLCRRVSEKCDCGYSKCG